MICCDTPRISDASHQSASTGDPCLAVKHGTDVIKDELETIVDYGGKILDVIIEHPVYGNSKQVS